MRAPLVAPAALALALAGCVGPLVNAPVGLAKLGEDRAIALPSTDFYARDGEPSYLATEGEARPFHTLAEIEARIAGWAEAYPDLVEVREIGRTIQDRPIHAVVLANKTIPGPKPAPFIDAGHHANEILGTELAMYTVDLLLENYGKNRTVTRWLDTLEIHTVPLVNVDGYLVQTRGNALGVNLNRNYDIDWGNPAGANNFVMGTLAHATGQAMPSVPVFAENAGPHAFSEPESRAIRDHLASLDGRLAYYVTYHTPTNGFIAPWSAADPPFAIPPEHDAVFERTLQWVRENTEYEAGKAQWGNFSAGLPYSASGSSQDWAYMRHNVPAYTLEIEMWYTSITSPDYMDHYLTPYPGVEHWIKTSLPISLYLLANAERLAAWQLPDVTPPLPEGIPPERPAAQGLCAPLPRDTAPDRPSIPYPVDCARLREHADGH